MHEYLELNDHYEIRDVNKGRNDKYCEHCGKLIPKGMPHSMHYFYPEFDSYPVHKTCNEGFMASLRRPIISITKMHLHEKK